MIPLAVRLVALWFMVGPPPGSSEERCVLTSATPIVATIRGRELYVEPMSLTRAGSRLLILGEPVLLLNPDERARVNGRVAVGALVSARGEATLVPAPAGSSGMRHPRALYEPGRGWHVFWLPELATLEAQPESASLAYALYDGRTWSAVQRVGTVGTIATGAVGLSQPVRLGNRLVIAMVDGKSMSERRVVLFVSNRRGTWDHSVVPGARPTAYTALAQKAGVATVVFTGRDTALQPALFSARSTSGGAVWSDPTLIVRASTSQPTITVANDALVTAWIEYADMRSTREIRLSRSHDRGRTWSTPISAGRGAVSVDYAMVAGGAEGFLMLRQVLDSGTAVSTALGSGRDSLIQWMDVSKSEAFLPLVASGPGVSAGYAAWGEAVRGKGGVSPKLKLVKVQFSCAHRASKSNLLPSHP